MLCFHYQKEQITVYNEYGLAVYDSTNNVAEYTGITKALEWLIANNFTNENVIVRGDSLLVVSQIKRKFKVKAPNIIPLYHKAMSLIYKFKHIEIEWIPRDQNNEADRLSYLAYEDTVRDRTKNEQTSL
jgi:ribonuclease HI